MTEALAEMDRSIRCLALELPEAVYEDVVTKWEALAGELMQPPPTWRGWAAFHAQLDVAMAIIIGEAKLDTPHAEYAPSVMRVMRLMEIANDKRNEELMK